MTEVTKSELAAIADISPSMVSKHVRKGVLDRCYTPNGKKLYLEKALAAIAEARKDFKKPMSEAIENANHDPEKEIIYSQENVEELAELLGGVSNPLQRVQIQKDFWTAKTNRQKFLKEEGELIYVNEAKAAVEELISPLNKFLDDLPMNIKAHHQEVPIRVIEWVSAEINRMKQSIQGHQWDV